MRLIDADDFDTNLFNDGFFGGLAAAIGNTPRKRKFTIGEFRGMLKKCPTVDAVPVVRCKDCKHWEQDDDIGHCSNPDGLDNYSDPDDFCSYGIPKDVNHD